MRVSRSSNWMAAAACLGLALMGACGDDDGGTTPDAMVAPPPDAATPDAAPSVDAGDDGGVVSDAAPPTMSITQIIPPAASREVTTELTVLGLNIASGASLTLDNCDTTTTYDLTSTVTVAGDGKSLTASLAMDSTREQGIYTVRVTNPDMQTDALECAFRILAAAPPTVTDVTPNTAFRGVPGDGVSSDTVVTISGTGFESTPAVRWVKTDGSVTYDALVVGFTSTTELTAVVPSETLGMMAGEYHVFVINPDLLGAQWQVGGTTPGIFTISTTPPPTITDIAPARIPNNVCTSEAMTATGDNFDAAATAWIVNPAGATCAGSTIDANGNVLCPMAATFVSAQELTLVFTVCPGNGAWPIRIINPDGQADTFLSVEVRPNSSGHLSADAFVVMPSTLNTARFKHGSEHGFDSFGNAYIYATGGQDATGVVLDNTEFAQLDAFGNVAPFAVSMQYMDAATPRVVNTLTTPRQGATMVRVGRSLFMLGGASEATDVAAPVTALKSVERAVILSFDEMPAVSLPRGQGGTGLPTGSWYYQVSAVGPWGESLGSREVIARNTAGQIEICWNAPSAVGTTSYNVYRSRAADGRANSTTLLATDISATCFTDDGVEERTPAPGNLRGGSAASAGTGLAEGNHLYRVSATISLTGGMPFETHAGYPITVAVSADDVTAGTNAVTLNWDAIPGAVYSVYKWSPADGEYRVLEGAAALASNTFTDDATAFDAGNGTPRDTISPLAHGSLSLWSDISRDMNADREGLDGVVITLEPPLASPGVVARILVAGGRSSNSAGTYHTTAESLGINDDGSFEANWTVETPEFTNARAFFSLLTTQGRNDTPVPPPPDDPPCGDLDGDGYISCLCGGDDCNDADPSVNPGATEVCGDGIDQDCDAGCGGADEPCACTTDADMDNHISAALCGGDDCCDDGSETAVLGCTATTAAGISPSTTEICGNGIDEDCDGIDPPCTCADDLDGDGHLSIACGGDDCCDVGSDTSLGCTDATAGAINPDATEVCSNGIDDDCDGAESICFSTAPVTAAPPQPDSVAYAPTRARALDAPTVHLATPRPKTLKAVAGGESVFVVAVRGDDDFASTNSASLDNVEVCMVDPVSGHLATDCGTASPATADRWEVQAGFPPRTTPGAAFAADALLYFDYLYAFTGLTSETINTPVARTLEGANFTRFPVVDPATVSTAMDNQLIEGRESANVGMTVDRAYYTALRLLSYIYVVGGHDATGPLDTVERHLQ